MWLDLEAELLRAAYAIHASNASEISDRMHPHFTVADLVELIDRSGAAAFPRLSDRLLADEVSALAASLEEHGYLERVHQGYALTAKAIAHVEREPRCLVRDER